MEDGFVASNLTDMYCHTQFRDYKTHMVTLDLYSQVLPNMQDELAGGCGQPSEAIVEISTIVETGYCVLLYTPLPVGNNGTAGPF